MAPIITTAEAILTATKLQPGQSVVPFMEFHQRIISGDIQTVRDVLSQMSVSEKNIVNCEVSYRENLSGLDGELQFKLPVALAAASGNTDMLQVVMSHGADVTRTDSSGNSILHSLVILSIRFPTRACVVYQYLVDSMTDRDRLQLMHRTSNDTGQTPLDLAAIHCVPEILQLILNTDDVYRFKLFTEGMFTKYEYKIPLQANPTFLHMITIATKDEIGRFSAASFFLNEPMKTLTTELKQKYSFKSSAVPFMFGVVYSIIYQFYILLYIKTHNTPPVAFTVTLMACLILNFGTECIYQTANMEFVHHIAARKKLGKYPYVLIDSLVISSVLFFCVTLSLCIVELVGVENLTVRSALYSISAPLSWAWLLYALVFSPQFSHLTLMIEKMIWEAWRILLLISFMCMLFAMCLYVLAVTPSETNGRTPANITQDYLQSKFSLTFYETFLSTFAGRSPDDIFFTESSVPVISILVYIISILDGAVLLLNLLIAIFSHQVDDVYRYQYEIQAITQLSGILMVRQRKHTHRNILNRMKRNRVQDCEPEVVVFTILQKEIPERQDDLICKT